MIRASQLPVVADVTVAHVLSQSATRGVAFPTATLRGRGITAPNLASVCPGGLEC